MAKLTDKPKYRFFDRVLAVAINIEVVSFSSILLMVTSSFNESMRHIKNYEENYRATELIVADIWNFNHCAAT